MAPAASPVSPVTAEAAGAANVDTARAAMSSIAADHPIKLSKETQQSMSDGKADLDDLDDLDYPESPVHCPIFEENDEINGNGEPQLSHANARDMKLNSRAELSTDAQFAHGRITDRVPPDDDCEDHERDDIRYAKRQRVKGKDSQNGRSFVTAAGAGAGAGTECGGRGVDWNDCCLTMSEEWLQPHKQPAVRSPGSPPASHHSLRWPNES